MIDGLRKRDDERGLGACVGKSECVWERMNVCGSHSERFRPQPKVVRAGQA